MCVCIYMYIHTLYATYISAYLDLIISIYLPRRLRRRGAHRHVVRPDPESPC